MTTELEKDFFDTIGIKPEEEQYCLWECKIPELEHVPCKKECQYQKHEINYPYIDFERLLKLLCLINSYLKNEKLCNYEFSSIDIEDLRDEILKDYINYFENGLNKYKKEIYKIFEWE